MGPEGAIHKELESTSSLGGSYSILDRNKQQGCRPWDGATGAQKTNATRWHGLPLTATRSTPAHQSCQRNQLACGSIGNKEAVRPAKLVSCCLPGLQPTDKALNVGLSLSGHTSHGYGSKLSHQGTAGFGPCFHLPWLHLGYLFLTHSHMANHLLTWTEHAWIANQNRFWPHLWPVTEEVVRDPRQFPVALNVTFVARDFFTGDVRGKLGTLLDTRSCSARDIFERVSGFARMQVFSGTASDTRHLRKTSAQISLCHQNPTQLKHRKMKHKHSDLDQVSRSASGPGTRHGLWAKLLGLNMVLNRPLDVWTLH